MSGTRSTDSETSEAFSVEPNELEHLLSEACTIPDCSLVIACETAKQASQLTAKLYEENQSETFHIEHYPITNDEDGTVKYIALLIQRLTYSHDLGWFSADVSGEPDFDLRRNDAAATGNEDLQNYSVVEETETCRHAVAAETVHDPHHNYTILGRIIEIDQNEFETEQEVATEAARQATEYMPESIDDILDNEFHVFKISGESKWVSTADV